MCVSVTFWGLVRDFEDEMGGFEKSAKTTDTLPRVPFQTKTRARAAAEVSAAETAATNITDTDWRHALGGEWRMLRDWSLIDADVSPTVGVLQPTLLYETLLEL